MDFAYKLHFDGVTPTLYPAAMQLRPANYSLHNVWLITHRNILRKRDGQTTWSTCWTVLRNNRSKQLPSAITWSQLIILSTFTMFVIVIYTFNVIKVHTCNAYCSEGISLPAFHITPGVPYIIIWYWCYMYILVPQTEACFYYPLSSRLPTKQPNVWQIIHRDTIYFSNIIYIRCGSSNKIYVIHITYLLVC